MKSFFRKIPRPPLIIVIILLATAVLLACGPATEATPSEQPGSSPVAKEKPTPEPTSTPEPTPLPTDVIIIADDGSYIEIPAEPPPKPTPKYAAIIDTGLQEDVVEIEATKEAQDGASGASGPRQVIEDPVVDVTVYLTANTFVVAEWVRSQGIATVHVREYEDGSGGRFSASVPLSLLGALANQEGVREIDPHREVRIDKE